MRFRLLLIFILLNLLAIQLYAQGLTITGRIVDAETLDPLPFAHIFIDQTTIGAVSDPNGEFILEHVEDGDYKIVFSYVGYDLYYKYVSIIGKDLRVSARLAPSKEMLESVEVKSSKDKVWEKELKQFNRVFFGESELAKDCKILNPWVLDFTYGKGKKEFIATASEPLLIQNRALGYDIECTLQRFSFDPKGYKIKGLYKFNEVNTEDPKQAAKWNRNRKVAYQGSLRFLFKSIIENHELENGFDIYIDKRPSLRIDNPYFANELERNVFKRDLSSLITPSGRPGYYRMTFNDRIEIHHTTQFAPDKIYRDVVHPISWIETDKKYIDVSQEGNIINSEQLVTSGELYKNRVANMLPLNYSPGSIVVVNYITKRMQAKRLQERVYCQTDKGFYRPGETLWFKAYLGYFNHSLRDSLSQVLYVDLVSPSKSVALTKKLKVENASAWGEFQLPNNLSPGIYYVRAYTSWMRNYGTDIIFHTPVAIMPNTMELISNAKIIDEHDITAEINGDKFFPSQDVTLNLSIDSTDNNLFADCSIAVACIESAIYPQSIGIAETLFFPEEMPSGTLGDFIYPLEYGFSINGQLYRPKKKHTTGEMSIIQGEMDTLYHIRTDSRGFFKIEDLNFFDTVNFAFQAKNKKGKIFGNTRLLQKDTPPIPQRQKPINNLDTILLKDPISFILTSIDTTKKEQKTNDITQESSSYNLGADHILTEEDLNNMQGSMDIIDALATRIPGFQVDPATRKISLRNRTTINGTPTEPIIVLDGIPMNNMGSNTQSNMPTSTAQTNTAATSETPTSQATGYAPAGTNPSVGSQIQQQTPSQPSSSTSSIVVRDMIGHIPVDNVTRVEITTRSDSHYGSTNGVISIFTKKAVGKGKEVKTFDRTDVIGFARPNQFKRSSHFNFNEEYKPTVYWNPSVNITATEQNKITFRAPDKPGNYLIRIEGVSSSGNPLSTTIHFKVEKSPNTSNVINLDQHQK